MGCLGVQSFCETSLEIRSGWGDLWLKFLKESMKLTVVLQGLWAEGRLNVVQWEHKLLFGGTISNSGDGRENVTCTFQVKLC